MRAQVMWRLGVVAGSVATTATMLVVSAGAAPPVAAPLVAAARLSGTDRYGTAAAVAETVFPPGVGAVILASGVAFPDALAGSFLAGADGAAVLLTDATHLPPATSAALAVLKTTKVIVLGGTDAVAANVEDQLNSLPLSSGNAWNVTRLAGTTRYDTMQLVDEAVAPATVGVVAGKRTAIVASGANFPDALAASPVAYRSHLPIVLTDPATLSPQALATLQSLGIQQVLIMGGTAAVSGDVEVTLNAAGFATARRFSGADRTDTAAQFAAYAVSTLNWPATEVTLARGDDFADALSAGQYARPVLLTESPDLLGTYATKYLQTAAGVLTKLTIIGGPAAITDATVTAATTAATPHNATQSPSTTSTPSATSTTSPSSTTSTTEPATTTTVAGPSPTTSTPSTTSTTAPPDPSPPLLTGVTASGANQATYTFNQPLDSSALEPNGFAYNDQSGNEYYATSAAVAASGRDVVATFGTGSGGPGPGSASTFRFVTFAGAVASAATRTPNPEGASPASSVKQRPTLNAVARIPGQPNVFDFGFDQPVSASVGTDFRVYRTTDGGRWLGTGVVAVDSLHVRVTFPSSLDSANVTLGAVTDNDPGPGFQPTSGAVLQTSTNLPNTVGSAPIQ